MEQFKKRKYRLRNHKTSKVEHPKRRRYNQRYHRTLEEGLKRERTKGNSRTRKGGGYSTTRKKDIQDTTSGNRITN
jgi:hypothetical protein